MASNRPLTNGMLNFLDFSHLWGFPNHHMITVYLLNLTLILLWLYVDDILTTGTSIHDINIVKQALDCQFTIKDLSLLKYFLGLEVARSLNSTHLS